MLHLFIVEHRDAIIAKAKAMLTARPMPPAVFSDNEGGVALFLTQLAVALQSDHAGDAYNSTDIATAGARRGRDLLAQGFTVSQLVHDYGDICQAVTQLAIERKLVIRTEEFRILNACLDTAIAEAVTEYGRLVATSDSLQAVGKTTRMLGSADNAIVMAAHVFDAIRTGKVPINGPTAAMLTRSLCELGELIGKIRSDAIKTWVPPSEES